MKVNNIIIDKHRFLDYYYYTITEASLNCIPLTTYEQIKQRTNITTNNYKEVLKNKTPSHVYGRNLFSVFRGECRKWRNRLQYQPTAASLSRSLSNVAVRWRNSLALRRRQLDTAAWRTVILEYLWYFIFLVILNLSQRSKRIQLSKPWGTIHCRGRSSNRKKRRPRWFLALWGEGLNWLTDKIKYHCKIII